VSRPEAWGHLCEHDCQEVLPIDVLACPRCGCLQLDPKMVCPLHGGRPCPRWCGWHADPPHARDGRTDSDPMVVAACSVLILLACVVGVIVFALTRWA
jgi:hypothetical protein